MNDTQRQQFATLFPTPERVLALVRALFSPDNVFSVDELLAFARTRGFVPRAEADVSAREAEGEIRVLDCCGDLGYSIPWAIWKTRQVPIVPTRNSKRPFVYLYGPASPPPTNWQESTPACVGNLGLAGYIRDDGSVEWDDVAKALDRFSRTFLSSTPPGSGPRVNGKPASTTESCCQLPDALGGCLGADGRRVRLVGSSPVAELCFDIGRAEPHVRELLKSFGAGRHGFLAMNLSATEAVRDLVARAVETIERDRAATEDDENLARAGQQVLALLNECRRVLSDERARSKKNAVSLLQALGLIPPTKTNSDDGK